MKLKNGNLVSKLFLVGISAVSSTYAFAGLQCICNFTGNDSDHRTVTADCPDSLPTDEAGCDQDHTDNESTLRVVLHAQCNGGDNNPNKGDAYLGNEEPYIFGSWTEEGCHLSYQ